MVTDTIADCLTRIRNSQRAGHKSAKVMFTKQVKAILEVLTSEGFVEGFEARKGETIKENCYEVFLKYFSPGEPQITLIRRVSKPGRRVYQRCEDLQKVRAGLGINLVSTSQGVMSDREARRRKLGGELLAQVA
jgi:small subunit ribosomal protein S8